MLGENVSARKLHSRVRSDRESNDSTLRSGGTSSTYIREPAEHLRSGTMSVLAAHAVQLAPSEQIAASLHDQCILLVNVGTRYQYPSVLIVKHIGADQVSFALAKNPMSHLLATRDAKIFVCGAAGGAGAVFKLQATSTNTPSSNAVNTNTASSPNDTAESEPEADECCFTLQVEVALLVSFEYREGTPVVPPRPWYLGVADSTVRSGKNSNQFTGQHMIGNCRAAGHAQWRAVRTQMPVSLNNTQIAETRYPDLSLSSQQRQSFAQDGYVVVEDAMPAGLVSRALEAIDQSLAAPDGRAQWDCTEGKASVIPECLDLWRHTTSPALTLCESLLGEGSVAQPVSRCQVALRFPEPWCNGDRGIDPCGWHVDGTIKGVHSPFSLLLGFALSDIPTKCLGGGLVVFPGTHLSMAADMRALVRGGADAESSALRTKPALSGGIELKARRGAIILVHQKVAHNGAPNISDLTRYCVYFRITHGRHKELQLAALDDPLLEFEGLRV